MYIPQLEKDGYIIDYKSKRDWSVTTPEGKTLLFKKYVGMCKGMPYLDIRDNHYTLVMIQTIRERFGILNEVHMMRSIESRDMQAQMSHPTDEKFKQLVVVKLLIIAL